MDNQFMHLDDLYDQIHEKLDDYLTIPDTGTLEVLIEMCNRYLNEYALGIPSNKSGENNNV